MTNWGARAITANAGSNRPRHDTSSMGPATHTRTVHGATREPATSSDYNRPRSHGPVIATVIPGDCRLTNNVCPHGSQHAPQNSLSR